MGAVTLNKQEFRDCLWHAGLTEAQVTAVEYEIQLALNDKSWICEGNSNYKEGR